MYAHLGAPHARGALPLVVAEVGQAGILLSGGLLPVVKLQHDSNQSMWLLVNDRPSMIQSVFSLLQMYHWLIKVRYM
jgi:hypothetical protein